MTDTAYEAAERISYDVTSRKGFDALWDEIEPDIQDEIVQEWAAIIRAAFGEAKS